MKRINTASNKLAIRSSASYKIVILGAGNVATHISRHLYSAGHIISCIYSRIHDSATLLAESVGSIGTNIPAEVPQHADFFIICVHDQAVREVVIQFRRCLGIWLHTSGALNLKVFEDYQSECGVLYPIQTLSMKRPIALEKTPFMLEGSTSEVLDEIMKLASTISGHLHIMDADTRLMIHLAAVFANNFSNHMVPIARQILKEEGIDVNLLDPLLRETFSKISELGPAGAQTGPASRGDEETMEKHLVVLRAHPEWKKLYTFISRDIGRFRKD